MAPPDLLLWFSDQVFGCSLADLCHRENATVPAFVKLCIDHVENTGGCWSGCRLLVLVLVQAPGPGHHMLCPAPAGLCVDGLYRVSGNLAIIQKLRYTVDRGEFPCRLIPAKPGRSWNSRLFVLAERSACVQMRRSAFRTGSGRTST